MVDLCRPSDHNPMLMNIIRSMTKLPLALPLLIMHCLAQAPTATLHTLYQFKGAATGGNPYANLVAGSSGVFYGTTNLGGSANLGTVFQLTPPGAGGGGWKETVIHNFTGAPDGAYPQSAVVIGSHGALYGVAGSVVFQLLPPTTSGGAWTENIIYTFSDPSKGNNPIGPLVIGPSGSFFGAAQFGGTGCTVQQGCGLVFELVPPSAGGGWKETTIWAFQGGADGSNPMAGVVAGKSGVIYGTTTGGGAFNKGTAFRLTPSRTGAGWTKLLLYSFGSQAGDGAYPAAPLVISTTAALYGTTSSGGHSNQACVNGCGVAFELAPGSQGPNGPWIEHLIHSFAGYPSDGEYPLGALVFGSNGYLYGTTADGGSGQCSPGRLGLPGCGIVFQLSPTGIAWTETILYNFSGGGDGARPFSGVIAGSNGSLLGTTSQAGQQSSCCGTVYGVTP